MKTIDDQLSEHAQKEQSATSEHMCALQYFDIFSSIVTESLYVLDIQQKQFCYVKPDGLFLCGFSAEEALKEGYNFYPKIIYSEDLPVWTKMYKAVLRYLKDWAEKWNEINYFSCSFRLQRSYSFRAKPLPQMIYHRMKPVRIDDKLWYLICSVESSSSKETGNLRLHHKGSSIYEAYNFTTRRWKWETIESLTEREKVILMLACQGKTTREIANDLCNGYNTIRNQIKPLFSKLNVHSMHEAIEWAHRHCMIDQMQNTEVQSIEASRKKSRILLTDEKLRCIQQHLDNGKSIRQTAKLEGVVESSIRYWKSKERLRI